MKCLSIIDTAIIDLVTPTQLLTENTFLPTVSTTMQLCSSGHYTMHDHGLKYSSLKGVACPHLI